MKTIHSLALYKGPKLEIHARGEYFQESTDKYRFDLSGWIEPWTEEDLDLAQEHSVTGIDIPVMIYRDLEYPKFRQGVYIGNSELRKANNRCLSQNYRPLGTIEGNKSLMLAALICKIKEVKAGYKGYYLSKLSSRGIDVLRLENQLRPYLDSCPPNIEEWWSVTYVQPLNIVDPV